MWIFWLRIKWIYNEKAFPKRSPYCFNECYFLELFVSVAHILESRKHKEIIFISFLLKHSLDVRVQFWWYSNILLHFYIQLSILKSRVSCVSWTLTYLHGRNWDGQCDFLSMLQYIWGRIERTIQQLSSCFFFSSMCIVKLDVPLNCWDPFCFSSKRKNLCFQKHLNDEMNQKHW